MKFLVIFLILFQLINSFAYAKLSSTATKVIKNKFYLGDKESDLLKKEIIQQKFNHETFVVKFRCDKYKRNPSSKVRRINCIALTLSPDIN